MFSLGIGEQGVEGKEAIPFFGKAMRQSHFNLKWFFVNIAGAVAVFFLVAFKIDSHEFGVFLVKAYVPALLAAVVSAVLFSLPARWI